MIADFFANIARWISALILAYLHQPTSRYAPFFAPDTEKLRAVLQPGDVLLVEGNTRLSAIIKFLTQSTWSHSALYIGDRFAPEEPDHERPVLLEADAGPGVTVVPLSKYAKFNTRICRPIGLSEADRAKVVDFAVARIGLQYDTRRIVDLLRYLFPYPPVPVFLRRRLLAIGSGDPTRAICSVLIAEAFESVRYPILPEADPDGGGYGVAPFVQREINHIRRSGLYTPRDFDVSPFFAVVKPTIESGFDPDAVFDSGEKRRAHRPASASAALETPTAEPGRASAATGGITVP